MAILTPPGFLQNAGATHTAAQLRTYLAALQAGIYSAATNIRARGGVHPGLGQEFLVTQAGSPNMTVLVEAGVCSIPGTEAGSQGNYLACNDAQATLSVTAAHATLPRIDIVVANVRDSFYSGANNDAQLQVVAGTAASSPVAPTAPANSITVAQIAVGAAVTSIVNANITDTRFYMAANGGVILIRNIGAIPASAEMNEGQLLWAMDTDILYVWKGAAAKQIYPNEVLIAVKTADEIVNNSITFQNDDHLTFSYLANRTYVIDGLLLMDGASNTPEYQQRFTFTAAAGTEFSSGLIGLAAAATSIEASVRMDGRSAETTSPSSGLALGTISGVVPVPVSGTLVVGATPGTLTLQWAQVSATAVNTTLKKGSWIRLMPIPN